MILKQHLLEFGQGTVFDNLDSVFYINPQFGCSINPFSEEYFNMFQVTQRKEEMRESLFSQKDLTTKMFEKKDKMKSKIQAPQITLHGNIKSEYYDITCA